MFSKQIVQTDAFMDMPQSSQLLYFHLAMEADDDGFISSPKKMMKLVGSNDDDYKVLLSKRFILPFKSGICVIKHWWIHNTLYKDRYHLTVYQDELKTLQIKDNGAYTDSMLTLPPQNVNKMLTETKLNKTKLNKIKKKKSEQSSKLSVKKEEKKKYGEFKNVLLTDIEFEKLIERLGNSLTSIIIEELSGYIESRGRRYSSHYATLLGWARRKKELGNNRGKSVAIIE